MGFPENDRFGLNQVDRPKTVSELQQFNGIGLQVDDQNKTITVSRAAINSHIRMTGIFACIDQIRSTGWSVRYEEDTVRNDNV